MRLWGHRHLHHVVCADNIAAPTPATFALRSPRSLATPGVGWRLPDLLSLVLTLRNRKSCSHSSWNSLVGGTQENVAGWAASPKPETKCAVCAREESSAGTLTVDRVCVPGSKPRSATMSSVPWDKLLNPFKSQWPPSAKRGWSYLSLTSLWVLIGTVGEVARCQHPPSVHCRLTSTQHYLI